MLWLPFMTFKKAGNWKVDTV